MEYSVGRFTSLGKFEIYIQYSLHGSNFENTLPQLKLTKLRIVCTLLYIKRVHELFTLLGCHWLQIYLLQTYIQCLQNVTLIFLLQYTHPADDRSIAIEYFKDLLHCEMHAHGIKFGQYCIHFKNTKLWS